MLRLAQFAGVTTNEGQRGVEGNFASTAKAAPVSALTTRASGRQQGEEANGGDCIHRSRLQTFCIENRFHHLGYTLELSRRACCPETIFLVE